MTQRGGVSDAVREFLREGEQAAARFCLTLPGRMQHGTSGTRLGKGAGSSLEFLDHREYQPGDDIRHINWNALARSDRLTVKLFREEVTPHVDLLLDGSRSMALEGTQKARAAAGLTGLLAQAAANAGFSCTPWLIGGGCRRVPAGHLPPSAWEELAFEAAGNGGEALASSPPSLRPLGIRILISDLFWSADPLQVVQQLAHQAAGVLVVQVVAATDVDPDFLGNIRLEDRETGEQVECFLDQTAVQRFREAFAGHQQNWQRACARLGVTLTTIRAETLVSRWEPWELVVAQFLTTAAG